MIVYARQYTSDNVSSVEYERFAKWAARELPFEISAWRTKLVVAEGEEEVFAIAVLDTSDDSRSLSFDWHGEPLVLPPEQTLAFIERRLSRALGAFAAGQRGRVSEKLHYGPEIAPKLSGDGVWEVPKPTG